MPLAPAASRTDAGRIAVTCLGGAVTGTGGIAVAGVGAVNTAGLNGTAVNVRPITGLGAAA